MNSGIRALKGRVAAALAVVAGLSIVSSATAELARPGELGRARKLVVGWHDEMNETREWQRLGAGMVPDLFAARPGAVTLRLPHAPEGFPYEYQWGGVMRQVDVDLGRYPVVAAYVSGVQDGSYAHLDLAERDYAGQPARSLRTPTLRTAGLITFDVGREWGSSTRRMLLRLIVGGPLTGASCEYAWVRFVRREDAARLRESLPSGNRGLPTLFPTEVELKP